MGERGAEELGLQRGAGEGSSVGAASENVPDCWNRK